MTHDGRFGCSDADASALVVLNLMYDFPAVDPSNSKVEKGDLSVSLIAPVA